MTAYHRLARETPGFQHWRMPVAALVGAIAYVAVSLVLGVVLAVVVIASGPGATDWLDSIGTQVDLDRPGVLLLQLGTIALFIPIVLGSVWLVWRPHTGYLHSVEGRLRWRWLGHCLALGFAVVGVSLALSIAVAAATGDEVGLEWPTGSRAWSLLVVLLLVPFQAAGEEYLFRGGLMQLIGSWTKRAAVPVVVTTLLFAAGHVYNIWGLLSVAVFGLTAAVITIRTGGLEAAIGLHVANNVLLMVLDLVGVVDSSGEGAGFLDEVLPTAVMCLVFALLVERSAGRWRLVRRRPALAETVTIQPFPTYPPPGPRLVGPDPAAVAGAAPAEPPVPPGTPPYPGDPGGWRR